MEPRKKIVSSESDPQNTCKWSIPLKKAAFFPAPKSKKSKIKNS